MSIYAERQNILESSKLRQERVTSLTLRVLASLFLLVAFHQHDLDLRTSLGMPVSFASSTRVLLEVALPGFANPARDEVCLRQDEDDWFRVRLEGAEVVAERWRVVEEREADVCESTERANQLRRSRLGQSHAPIRTNKISLVSVVRHSCRHTLRLRSKKVGEGESSSASPESSSEGGRESTESISASHLRNMPSARQ